MFAGLDKVRALYLLYETITAAAQREIVFLGFCKLIFLKGAVWVISPIAA